MVKTLTSLESNLWNYEWKLWKVGETLADLNLMSWRQEAEVWLVSKCDWDQDGGRDPACHAAPPRPVSSNHRHGISDKYFWLVPSLQVIEIPVTFLLKIQSSAADLTVKGLRRYVWIFTQTLLKKSKDCGAVETKPWAMSKRCCKSDILIHLSKYETVSRRLSLQHQSSFLGSGVWYYLWMLSTADVRSSSRRGRMGKKRV